MPETERNSVIIGLQKIADTKSVRDRKSVV